MAKPKPEAAPWSAFEWSLFHEWAVELGVAFDDVQRSAGLTPQSEGSRSSAWRAEQGGAPRVRRAVYDELVKREKAAARPTKIGEVALGVEEWTSLGQQLAMLATPAFLEQLQEARQALADATGRPVVGARPKKKLKATKKLTVQTPERQADELPGESATRKRR